MLLGGLIPSPSGLNGGLALTPVEDLFAVLGESRSPFLKRSLVTVEEQLGLALPCDYRAWAQRYASLEFGKAVAVVNFACVAGDARREAGDALAAQRHSTRVLGAAERVYDASGLSVDFEGRLDRFYPETPGLLWWGSAVGGYEFAWYTAGAADDWKTVIIDEAGDLHAFDSGFAELVLRLIRDDLGPRLSAGAWFSKCTIGELWGYRTVTIAGREYQAADFRPIGELPPGESI